MEDWYPQQEFFDEMQLKKIKAWACQEIIDLFQQDRFSMQPEFAV